MNKPLVSIILSTYNGSKYICESIESVLDQSFKNFEFIIINDASNDNVEEIILQYKKSDPRIIYIKNKENLGLTCSLNTGIQNSQGTYIARIDDDDIWMKGKLQKQIDFMENNIDYCLIGTSTIHIDKNGKEKRKIPMRESDVEIKNNILKSNQFTHSSVIMRKESLDKVGGQYNKNYNGAEDYELWLRLGLHGKFYNLQEYLVKYRWLTTSISRKKWIKQEMLTFKIMLKNRIHYPYFYKSFLLRIGYFITLFFKKS